jgi:hypothetical protein
MVDGMTQPVYVPVDQIVIDDESNVNNINNLRPNSKVPLMTSKSVLMIKVWLMPEVPISSASLVTSKNVKSYDVYYVKPGRASKDVPYREASINTNKKYICIAQKLLLGGVGGGQ